MPFFACKVPSNIQTSHLPPTYPLTLPLVTYPHRPVFSHFLVICIKSAVSRCTQRRIRVKTLMCKDRLRNNSLGVDIVWHHCKMDTQTRSVSDICELAAFIIRYVLKFAQRADYGEDDVRCDKQSKNICEGMEKGHIFLNACLRGLLIVVEW